MAEVKVIGFQSHPVLSCAEAQAWEARLLPGETAEWAAMQQAGQAIAQAVQEDYLEIGGLRANARLLVLAGRGHNGGDALLAARAILADRPEARALVVLCFGAEAMRPLAGRALDWLKRDAPGRVEIIPAAQAVAASQTYALCLDGIFGFNFRLPMEADITALITTVNANPGIRFRAAVDLPSGVGETNAPAMFRADFTYATGIVKQPVLAAGAAAAVGRLRYLDIGFFGAESAPEVLARVLTMRVLAPLGELRAAQTDKRTYGHLFVAGGSRSYPGAVVLAVRAALRSGAGLVTAFVPERLAPDLAARHPEAMWVGCPETPAGGLAAGTAGQIRERLARATAMLIGPGLGADGETLGWVAKLAGELTVPLVLDADALRPEVVAACRGKPVICTPHAGEYERIGGKAGLRPAPRQAMITVLKGPLTRVVVASGRSETGPTYYSPFGGPVLARGGSGDILAGLIGGLLAQKPDDLELAACRGVVWHGRAADLLARTRGQVAVEISEIFEQLGPALLP